MRFVTLTLARAMPYYDKPNRAQQCHTVWHAVSKHLTQTRALTHTHKFKSTKTNENIEHVTTLYRLCAVLSSKWTVPLDKTNEFQTKQINLEINLKMWSNLVGSLCSFMGFTYLRCKWRWMPNIYIYTYTLTTLTLSHCSHLLSAFSFYSLPSMPAA